MLEKSGIAPNALCILPCDPLLVRFCKRRDIQVTDEIATRCPHRMPPVTVQYDLANSIAGQLDPIGGRVAARALPMMIGVRLAVPIDHLYLPGHRRADRPVDTVLIGKRCKHHATKILSTSNRPGN